MLIVSDFRDYYDTATVYGVDKTVVYNRKLDELKAPKEFEYLPSYETLRNRKLYFEVFKHVIGFCGKLYPVIEMKPYAPPGVPQKPSEFYYTADLTQDFITLNNLVEREKYRYKPWRRDYSVSDPRTLNSFFDVNEWKFLDGLFLQHKTPIFVYRRDTHACKLTINPILREFRFMPVKDPVTAFQDIYMYISGVLGVESRPMVEISDEDKAHKKGHGGKYSFRKPPGTKKGKPKWR